MGSIGDFFEDLWKGDEISKDQFAVDVLTVPMLEPDLLEETRKRLVLEYVKKGLSAKDYVMNYGNTGAAQFFQYYRNGIYDFGDYLPDTTVGARSIDVDTIKTLLSNKEGTPVTFVSGAYGIPDRDKWTKFQLQESIGYNVGLEFAVINDNIYTITLEEYNATTNQYDITLKTTYAVHIVVTDTTVTTITPLSETEDTKHVKVTRRTDYYRIETTAEGNDVYHFLYYKEEVTQDGTTTIPKDSEESGTVAEIISETDRPNPGLTYTISIPTFTVDTAYITVTYTVGTPPTTKLWLYDPKTNVYPEVQIQTTAFSEIEMYPIVCLRNNGFGVDEYDVDSKVIPIEGDDPQTLYRPPAITEERYKETSKMLTDLGMDVDTILENINMNPDINYLQSAFIMFGVRPADNTPIVSKALFDTFEYIFGLIPPTEFMPPNPFDIPPEFTFGKQYTATFYETPYNLQINFIPVQMLVEDKVIGRKGTYQHTIYKNSDSEAYLIGGNIRMEKQISDTQVKTITIGGFRGQTTISQGEYTAIAQASLYESDNWFEDPIVINEDCIIPLPVKVVEAMSYIERTDLYAHSLHMTFYAARRERITYYEGGIFREFLQMLAIVISIVVAVIAPPAGAALGAAVSGLTAIGVSIGLANLLVNLLVGLALSVVLKVISGAVGDKLGAIIGLVVSIVMTYVGGGFQNAFSNTASSLKTAVQLAEIPTKIVDIYVQDKIADINDALASLDKKLAAMNEIYGTISEQYQDILDSMNSGIDAGFLADLNYGGNHFMGGDVGRLLSPSAFFYASKQGQYGYDSLYTNDITTYVDRTLALGLLD